MWENPLWPCEWSCHSLAWLSLVLDGLPPCFYHDQSAQKKDILENSSSFCSHLRCSTVSNCWQNSSAILHVCAQCRVQMDLLVALQMIWNWFYVILIPWVQIQMLVTVEQKHLLWLHTSNLTCFSVKWFTSVWNLASHRWWCLGVSVRIRFYTFRNTLGGKDFRYMTSLGSFFSVGPV